MTATTAEPQALRILRDIIEGDDNQMMAALQEGRGLLLTLRVAGARGPAPLVGDEALNAIIRLCAKRHGYTEARLMEQEKTRSLANARMIAMVLCREIAGATFQEIGRRFKGRHHGTAMSAMKSVAALCATDAKFRLRFESLKAEAIELCGRADA